ncbi:hypothetical protein BRD56_05440 [Thermoplasmatales archaeon SW_10_69_26]|nr:MAG: hypothetical protein BRD56_05440 [Thermoplasmatales archaeon SW_10_69_26]
MSDDYLHVVDDHVGAAVETTKYNEESLNQGDYLGYLVEEIEWPNPNPQGPLPHKGTKRGPYAHAPEAKSYEWDIEVVPIDSTIPLEIALGTRTESTVDTDGDSADEYQEVVFTEAAKLSTATIRRVQTDLSLAQSYIGTKTGLNISWALNEPLSITFNCVAARMNYDTNPPSPPDLDPPVKAPFMGWMLGSATIDGQEFATIEGGDVSVDHGLESVPGGDGGREGHYVSEETGAELFDASLSMTVTDTYLFEKVATDGALFDVEAPLHRDRTNDPVHDAFILTLGDNKALDAPVSSPDEGRVVDDVELSPKSIQIEIRDPL